MQCLVAGAAYLCQKKNGVLWGLNVSMQHEIHVTKKPNGEQTTKGDELVASGLSKRAVISYILLRDPAQFFVPTNGDCYTFIMAPLRNYSKTPLFRLFV